MGRLFTDKERRTFEQICTLRQSGIFQMMRQFLKSKYKEVIVTPFYIVAIGDIPVGLVAHADTVFKSPPKEFYYDKQKNVMWSPQGLGADDRAGIFAIMKIIALGQRPHIIITTDEEIGGIGSNKLVGKIKTFPAPLKFLIQLDRRNHKDAVYYDCDNKEFEKFINSFGFITEIGSFTDISILAPAWKTAAVNLSVGYQNEHSYVEQLFVNNLFDTIDKVQTILNKVATDSSTPIFEYIERPMEWGYNWYDDGYSLNYNNWYNKLEEGEERCQFCGDTDKRENLLLLHWHAGNSKNKNLMFYICNECYARSMNEIEWCNKCNLGYFLTQNDLKNMPKDRTKWICKHCQEEEKTDDTVG